MNLEQAIGMFGGASHGLAGGIGGALGASVAQSMANQQAGTQTPQPLIKVSDLEQLIKESSAAAKNQFAQQLVQAELPSALANAPTQSTVFMLRKEIDRLKVKVTEKDIEIGKLQQKS